MKYDLIYVQNERIRSTEISFLLLVFLVEETHKFAHDIGFFVDITLVDVGHALIHSHL